MKRPSAPFLLSYGAVTLTDESSDLLLVGHKLAVERLEAFHADGILITVLWSIEFRPQQLYNPWDGYQFSLLRFSRPTLR